MYPEIVPTLRCPRCSATPLTLLGPLTDDRSDEIVAGALRCEQCRSQTAIRDGIWDALDDGALPLTPAQLTNYLPITARLYEPAWRWQALSLMSGRRFPLREEWTLLRELIQPHADQIYVDVACSAGLYARALAVPGAIVVGVDHAWAFVRHARQIALERGLRISYVRASAQALPFASGVAAGVAMGGSLNEIGDQIAALREIRRIMQPQARFFNMSLMAAESGWGRTLQTLLGTGGIDFPDQRTFAMWLDAAELEPIAHWRWRVVTIALLRAAHR